LDHNSDEGNPRFAGKFAVAIVPIQNCLGGSMKFNKVGLWAGICCALFASVSVAQTAAPATGMGQSWPNATDQSQSPNWHVFVFYLNGIKYVQVNDLNGNVHAAISSLSGIDTAMPVGVDAQNVQPNTAAPAASAATVIYNDATTTVTAVPQSDGTTQFFSTEVSSGCSTSGQCTGGRGE
jgi:hypothetical protein